MWPRYFAATAEVVHFRDELAHLCMVELVMEMLISAAWFVSMDQYEKKKVEKPH